MELVERLHAMLTDIHASLVVGLADVIRTDEYDVAARPKTSEAIVAKLGRSTTSLSRMQDIAGGRLVVPTIGLQRKVAELLLSVLEYESIPTRVKDTSVIADSLGYRAVHIVAEFDGRLAEIQLRTLAQQRWAQVVEWLDQALGTDLKHGDGPAEWLGWLLDYSEATASAERGEPRRFPDPPQVR